MLCCAPAAAEAPQLPHRNKAAERIHRLQHARIHTGWPAVVDGRCGEIGLIGVSDIGYLSAERASKFSNKATTSKRSSILRYGCDWTNVGHLPNISSMVLSAVREGQPMSTTFSLHFASKTSCSSNVCIMCAMMTCSFVQCQRQ